MCLELRSITLFRNTQNASTEWLNHDLGGLGYFLTVTEDKSSSMRINPRLTYTQLGTEAGVLYGRSTLYRTLKNYGLTNWLAKKRPLLTPKVAKKRWDWCVLHSEWTFEQWSKIIWSDECSVEKGSGKQRQWMFRFPEEKWNKKIIQPVPKGKGVGVMVWAAFWGEGRSDLYKLARDFESKKIGYSANSYLEILDNNLLGI